MRVCPPQLARPELACALPGRYRALPCRATDETYVRAAGQWRYLRRAVDQNGRFIDIQLTSRPDAKAAKTFPKQAIKVVRLYRPVSICTPSCLISVRPPAA
ncbi:DDE-type integrase/transposase/recombinase [uncultured Jannaschia sp.]|uniref:DDE-type integrase/transposase/recombinase n=1 Tax=uncultured Jannaschia sp. TaxID=293347 RepID=UPI00345BD766